MERKSLRKVALDVFVALVIISTFGTAFWLLVHRIGLY